jgi:hypothetical protein
LGLLALAARAFQFFVATVLALRHCLVTSHATVFKVRHGQIEETRMALGLGIRVGEGRGEIELVVVA